jgi:hypothetical protein
VAPFINEIGAWAIVPDHLADAAFFRDGDATWTL